MDYLEMTEGLSTEKHRRPMVKLLLTLLREHNEILDDEAKRKIIKWALRNYYHELMGVQELKIIYKTLSNDPLLM
jgi:hypothetical protein